MEIERPSGGLVTNNTALKDSELPSEVNSFALSDNFNEEPADGFYRKLST